MLSVPVEVSECAGGGQEREGPSPAILRLQCAQGSPGAFHTRGSESEVWGGAPQSAFLRSSQVMSRPLLCLPHLEKQGSIP